MSSFSICTFNPPLLFPVSFPPPLLTNRLSIESYILSYLGPSYSADLVAPYISENFTSQDYLLPYVKEKWQANIDNCPL